MKRNNIKYYLLTKILVSKNSWPHIYETGFSILGFITILRLKFRTQSSALYFKWTGDDGSYISNLPNLPLRTGDDGSCLSNLPNLPLRIFYLEPGTNFKSHPPLLLLDVLTISENTFLKIFYPKCVLVIVIQPTVTRLESFYVFFC